MSLNFRLYQCCFAVEPQLHERMRMQFVPYGHCAGEIPDVNSLCELFRSKTNSFTGGFAPGYESFKYFK